MLLTRTPLYSPDCSGFLVRLACVKRAASVDSEPGSNSHLKHMRMARDKPRPQDRSAIYSEFSDEFFLLHPTRLSKICAARTDIDNTGTCCRPRNLKSIAPHKGVRHRRNRKFKKSQTGRPYSTFPVARESFVTIPYRGLSIYTTLRPAVANPVC